MIYEGHGASVELRQDGITIRRKGALSFVNHGLNGEKRIPFSSISAVQFKEAGMTAGYLQVSLLGGIESRGGVLAATQDENTILFTKEQAPRFAELRDTIEQRAAATRQPQGYSIAPASASLSEELTRLADLRDRGVLSEDEFANEKQALFARRNGPPKVETTAETSAPTLAPHPAETSAPTVTTRPVEAPAKMDLGEKSRNWMSRRTRTNNCLGVSWLERGKRGW